MKSLLLFSGGYDSVAALDIALKDLHHEVVCVFVDYGQPYCAQEYSAAMYAFKHYEVKRYPVEFIFQNLELGLTGEDYVPYRNLVFGALAFNLASTNGCGRVLTGSKSASVREDDSHSFIDSSKPFYDRLHELVVYATEDGHEAPKMDMPVVGWTKAQILRRVHEAGIELQMLWSCYKGGNHLPCGECHACKVVREGLVEAGLDRLYPHMLKVSA
jgi:7-cyano-7-deazaguanine synthase